MIFFIILKGFFFKKKQDYFVFSIKKIDVNLSNPKTYSFYRINFKLGL